MLIVIAGSNDISAYALVRTWKKLGCVLMAPQDLAMPGWKYRPGSGRHSTFVAGGVTYSTRTLRGVLTRLATVPEDELTSIVPGDRSYVAAETTAMLLAWLTDLEVPVINSPTATCLAGTYWRQEKWMQVACDLGLAVSPYLRRAVLDDPTDQKQTDERRQFTQLAVIGSRCVGNADPSLCSAALKLARAASLQLLGVEYNGAEAGAEFINAHLWPDIASGEAAEAILELFSDPSSVRGMQNDSSVGTKRR